ncbi:MAG: thiamine phosphate synthase [Pseudomonadota bacterium]
MAETTPPDPSPPQAMPPRLYLVTPALSGAETARFSDTVEAALATGLVACLRLAMVPDADDAAWTAAANRLLPLCHAADVPLVATDRPMLVAPLGLDGVHLSASSASIGRLRKELGKDVIIGADGGAERHRAMVLAEAGADYVTIGPVAAAGDELYQWWSEMIETPVVAEGGIDVDAALRLGPMIDFATPDPDLIWPSPATALPAFAEALGSVA